MKPRLYLDTSVVSAYVDERAPERQEATIEFWGRLADFDVAISELTRVEIQATEDSELRERMEGLVDPFVVLRVDDETRRLAREYVRREVFSAGMILDAMHVAAAVVSRQGILVSWNFRHLVNRRRRALINEVNILMGYPTIEILAPPEI